LRVREGAVTLEAAEARFATPLAAGDATAFWPKQYEVSEDGDSFTLTKTFTRDGKEYRVEQLFGAEKPQLPDYGGLVGWWKNTSSPLEFSYIAPMDILTAFGIERPNEEAVTGPYDGNLVSWSYTDSDEDGVPEASELESVVGISAGFTRDAGRLTYHGVTFGGTDTIQGSYSFTDNLLTIDLEGFDPQTYEPYDLPN